MLCVALKHILSYLLKQYETNIVEKNEKPSILLFPRSVLLHDKSDQPVFIITCERVQHFPVIKFLLTQSYTLIA